MQGGIAAEGLGEQEALAQIAEVGAPALSLRAVARAVEMSPAGLYRYYDGRDALLTALLVDAYDDLADTVAEAIGPLAEPDGGGDVSGPEELRARLVDGIEAYRRWALDHPNRFLLIFGTPVPGYAAPEGGPTVQANRRMGMAFLVLAARAHAAGALRAIATDDAVVAAEQEIADQLGTVSPGFPAGLVRHLLGMWARWHGLVILEVTHQWDWAYEDPATLFADEVAAMIDGLLQPAEAPPTSGLSSSAGSG